MENKLSTSARIVQTALQSKGLPLQVVELDRAYTAVLVFSDKADIHIANNTSLRQIQKLRNNLSTELVAIENDQSII